MKRVSKHVRTLPVVFIGLMLLGTAASFAQRNLAVLRSAKPAVKVALAGFVERENALVPVEKTSVVKSGEVLDWTINSANDGNAAALDYKAVGHIPAGTTFITGSAKADGSVKTFYSIDKGKSYWEQPTIDERQLDGSVKKVPAPVSMYTDIRYEWSDALVEGGKLSASYKVRVN
jgi:uncharacterized repeat protein (TIGR01451 family)